MLNMVFKHIEKNLKFKIGDHMNKTQNIFVTSYTPNWSEEVFVIRKVKNTVTWPYVVSDLNVEEIVGTWKGIEEDQPERIPELKKYWREKVIDRTLNGRAIITHSIAGLIWKI